MCIVSHSYAEFHFFAPTTATALYATLRDAHGQIPYSETSQLAHDPILVHPGDGLSTSSRRARSSEVEREVERTWCRASRARVGLKDPARNLSRTRAGMGARGGSSTITTTAFAFACDACGDACGDAGDVDETAVWDMSLRQ